MINGVQNAKGLLCKAILLIMEFVADGTRLLAVVFCWDIRKCVFY